MNRTGGVQRNNFPKGTNKVTSSRDVIGWTSSPAFLNRDRSASTVAINQLAIHFHTTRFKPNLTWLSHFFTMFQVASPMSVCTTASYLMWFELAALQECLHWDHFLEATLTTKCIWPLSCLALHTFFPRVIFISNLILDLYSSRNHVAMTKSTASPLCAHRALALYRLFLGTPTNRIHHTIIPIQVIAFLQAIRPRGPFVHRKLCS